MFQIAESHADLMMPCISIAGLRFIGHNSSFVTDDKCDKPAGFNVIFPGMLERGIGMGLEIPLAHADVDAILRLRDTELKRFVDLIASPTVSSALSQSRFF